MESLKNKIVFISGASSGIGKACAESFAAEGCKLIITARRGDILEEIAGNLKIKYRSEIMIVKVDIRNYAEVRSAVSGLPEEWEKIDILINNAGLVRGLNRIYEDNVSGWEEMIDTNIKGLLYLTREVVPGMAKRKSGHIINIGSISGHEVYPGGGVYCATKFAVQAITKSLRIDALDKNIRVTAIDPGMVETDFSKTRFYGDEDRAKAVYKGIVPLSGKDVAEAAVFSASRPAHVNINEIIIMPAGQANTTMVYREL